MRYFDLSWSEIDFTKQQSMIKEVAESLIEFWSEEGLQFLEREWHVKPKTWQEAFCRMYEIDHRMWNDLEETSEEFQKYDWIFAIEQESEKVAEVRCAEAVRKIEIQVRTGI